MLLRDVEVGGERNRLIYVLKARGMAHSNQVREFLITSKGVKLVEAYLGPQGVLTGSARLSQEANERAAQQLAKVEMQRKKLALDHRRKSIEAQIAALRAGFVTEEEEFERTVSNIRLEQHQMELERSKMAASRGTGGGRKKQSK